MRCANTLLSENHTVINQINRFMRSPAYILCVMLLTALANLFSLELVTYSAYALLIAYICIFGTDFLPILPIFRFCLYFTLSRKQPRS